MHSLGPAQAVGLGTGVDHRGVACDVRLRAGLQELLQPELCAVHIPLPGAGRDQRVVGGLRWAKRKFQVKFPFIHAQEQLSALLDYRYSLSKVMSSDTIDLDFGAVHALEDPLDAADIAHLRHGTWAHLFEGVGCTLACEGDVRMRPRI